VLSNQLQVGFEKQEFLGDRSALIHVAELAYVIRLFLGVHRVVLPCSSSCYIAAIEL